MDQVIREEMRKLFKLGFNFIPLKKHSKEPKLPVGHPYLRVKPEREDYRSFDFHNYGIICGPISGICVLDIDGEKGRETLSRRRIHLDDYFTPKVHTPNDGIHLYFKYNPAIRTGAGVIGPGVDIRSHGGYVVGPKSEIVTKDTGEVRTYDWVPGFDVADVEIIDPPEWMCRIQTEEVRGLNSTVEIGDKIPEGQRNNTFTSIAGTLFARLNRRRLPAPVVYKMLQVVNQEMCTPPLDDAELEHIVKSIERKENGER